MASKTILVIEDNKLNMKLVRSLLAIGKYRALEAEDAERGSQLAREKHPDLILMDIQLPGMGGLTAIRILKTDSAVKDIAIVALTSHAMDGDDKKALDADCDGYVTKPIDTKNFLDTIGQFLKK